jgi:hypothetical protein
MQLQGPLRLAFSGNHSGLGGNTTRVEAVGVCDKKFFLQLAASVIAPRQAILANFRIFRLRRPLTLFGHQP